MSSQIPTLKFLNTPPPPAPQVPPQQQNEKYVQYVVTCLERALGSRLWCLTFPLVSGVMCGAWLYRFLIFALSLTFFLLFVKTHKKFGIKNLWNWHGNRNSMIFDLLTSLQGHQFDPRMKIFLAFCSARQPRRFDMPLGHVWIFFWPPGHPKRPKVPPLGHDPGDRMKIPSDSFCIFHLWEHSLV